MPRIQLPKRKRRFPTGRPSVPTPTFPTIPTMPEAASWEGRAIKQLGQTLGRIGGQLGGLALGVKAAAIRKEKEELREKERLETLAQRAQKLAIKDRVSQATLESTNALEAYQTELLTENKDPLTWGDKIEKKTQEVTAARRMVTPEGQKMYDRWADKFGSSLRNRMVIAGMRQAHRNYIGNLRSTVINYVDSGQMDEVISHLDDGIELGAIAEDKARGMKVFAVSRVAYNILAKEGIEPAAAYVNTQKIVELDAIERDRIHDILDRELQHQKALSKETGEEEKFAAVSSLFKRAGDLKEEYITTDDIEDARSILQPTEAERWVAIREGLDDPKVKEKDVDWKKYNELLMRMFDHWGGRRRSDDETDVGEAYILTDIASARFAERYINDEMFAELRGMLNRDVPPEHRGGLKEGFRQIEQTAKERRYRYDPIFGRFYYSQSEAKSAASARIALVDWLFNQRVGKKETNEEDIVAEARRLIAVNDEGGGRRQKGRGYFGVLELPGGGIATEYSIGVEINGKEVEIPTLVPTLTKVELFLMINDIIPNKKEIPAAIRQKAIRHAERRIEQGMSPFKETEPITEEEIDKEPSTLEEFKETAIRIGIRSKEALFTYYNKWKDKWK